MTTAEQRSARARKAARIRWAWGTEGRVLRAEMYYRRIIRAARTGDPRWLTFQHRAAIRRVLFGVPHGDEHKRADPDLVAPQLSGDSCTAG